MTYADDGMPLIVLAGADYGSGSSRDWAAKGTLLLGVKAVLATSFERIHRSNLVGMGVLPLQFQPGESARQLSLSGEETYSVTGLEGTRCPGGHSPRRGGRSVPGVHRDGTDRHPGRGRVLPPRRDPALRPAPAAGSGQARDEGGVRCRRARPRRGQRHRSSTASTDQPAAGPGCRPHRTVDSVGPGSRRDSTR